MSWSQPISNDALRALAARRSPPALRPLPRSSAGAAETNHSDARLPLQLALAGTTIDSSARADVSPSLASGAAALPDRPLSSPGSSDHVLPAYADATDERLKEASRTDAVQVDGRAVLLRLALLGVLNRHGCGSNAGALSRAMQHWRYAALARRASSVEVLLAAASDRAEAAEVAQQAAAEAHRAHAAVVAQRSKLFVIRFGCDKLCSLIRSREAGARSSALWRWRATASEMAAASARRAAAESAQRALEAAQRAAADAAAVCVHAAELDAAHAREEALSDRVTALEAQLVASQHREAAGRESIAAAEAQLADSVNRSGELAAALAAAQAQLASLQEQLSSSQAEVSTLRAKAADLADSHAREQGLATALAAAQAEAVSARSVAEESLRSAREAVVQDLDAAAERGESFVARAAALLAQFAPKPLPAGLLPAAAAARPAADSSMTPSAPATAAAASSVPRGGAAAASGAGASPAAAAHRVAAAAVGGTATAEVGRQVRALPIAPVAGRSVATLSSLLAGSLGSPVSPRSHASGSASASVQGQALGPSLSTFAPATESAR